MVTEEKNEVAPPASAAVEEKMEGAKKEEEVEKKEEEVEKKEEEEEKKEEKKEDSPVEEKKEEPPVEEKKETVDIDGNSYFIVEPPQMIPVGFKAMIDEPSNHKTVVKRVEGGAKIVIIGSGFHKAMEFRPILKGVTPDITDQKMEGEGIIKFATLEEVSASVRSATSLVIRKDTMEDSKLMEERLEMYKSNFITWIQSMVNDEIKEENSGGLPVISITFIRNIYPAGGGTKIKAAWVTGLGVDAALDCGSGKVALVDGVTGAQLQGSKKWSTNLEDPRWTTEDIVKNAEMLSNICTENGRSIVPENVPENENSSATLAYATGNWRKPHMLETIAPFRLELAKKNINFQLLEGSLEAKFGGISTLKCAAPYDAANENWVVMELGGGSTQITRFQKEKMVVKE